VTLKCVLVKEAWTVKTVPAQITLHSTAMGGRTRAAALDGRYRPHLQVGSGEPLGVEVTSADQSEVLPGESASVKIRLLYDTVDYSALTPGAKFSVLEGPRVIGVGEVLAP
jgi:translation elongation factor EF-Tu-like GTPase